MPRLKNYVKKLSRPFQQVVLDVVEDILVDPHVDEFKKGNYAGFTVHKFKMNRQWILKSLHPDVSLRFWT